MFGGYPGYPSAHPDCEGFKSSSITINRELGGSLTDRMSMLQVLNAEASGADCVYSRTAEVVRRS